jgi:uncharacterized RDD family membrane protein YckC
LVKQIASIVEPQVQQPRDDSATLPPPLYAQDIPRPPPPVPRPPNSMEKVTFDTDRELPESFILASPGSRLAAQILDGLIYLFLMIPIFMGLALYSEKKEQDTAMAIRLVSMGVLLTVVLFIVQGVFLCSQGQTLGKKMMSVRIVNHDNSGNPGFGRAFLLRYFANTLLIMIPWLGWIYSMVDVLFIFRGDRRCIHDLMAMTKVVQVHKSG